MSKELIDAIVEMRDKDALQITQDLMDKKVDFEEILDDCHEAMKVVGERFESREYFLPELIMGGDILKKIAEKVKPQMEASAKPKTRLGKIVLGTVQNDIHDIGKDIVGFMLDVNGFEVIDVGVDVPAKAFVDKVKEVEPQIVGLSGFLTVAFDAMKETVEALNEAGFREKVKIMIGGGTVTEEIVGYTGADAFGEDAMAAVQLAKKWTGG
jgi:methanogenic corrinoid protein MtbC1